MINNYICAQCRHAGICKIQDKIDVFSNDLKKPLNVDITVDRCNEFDPVEERE